LIYRIRILGIEPRIQISGAYLASKRPHAKLISRVIAGPPPVLPTRTTPPHFGANEFLWNLAREPLEPPQNNVLISDPPRPFSLAGRISSNLTPYLSELKAFSIVDLSELGIQHASSQCHSRVSVAARDGNFAKRPAPSQIQVCRIFGNALGGCIIPVISVSSSRLARVYKDSRSAYRFHKVSCNE
jgi:hypothetical protein